MLTSDQLARFRRDGVLLLKSFYDLKQEIEPVQKAIYHIIGLVIDKYGLEIERPGFSGDAFDAGYRQIIQTKRQYGAEIYDAVKQIPAFIRLLGSNKHERLCQALLATDLAGVAAAGYGIRIDNPYEDQFRAHWHQEYLSQLRSMKGAIFWSPLVEVGSALGPVQICPGSHREGVFQVTSNNPESSGQSGAYALRLVDEDQLVSRFSPIAPLSRPGDLLILDWFTLHRSGFNTSDRARWSMQMRYFDFNDEAGISMAWRGSFAAGINVREIHPEYFADWTNQDLDEA